MSDKSTSHERKIQGYLKPKNYTMFKGFVNKNELTDSAAINLIIRDYFSRFSEREYLDLKKSNSQKASY